MQECSQKIVVIKMYSKETWEIMFKENLIFQFSWLEEFRKENISEWRTLDKLQCKNSLSFTLMVLNNYWIKGCPFFFFFFFFWVIHFLLQFFDKYWKCVNENNDRLFKKYFAATFLFPSSFATYQWKKALKATILLVQDLMK